MTFSPLCMTAIAGVLLVGGALIGLALGHRAGKKKYRSEQAMFSFALTGNLMTIRQLMEEGRDEEVKLMLQSTSRSAHNLYLAHQRCLTHEQRGRLKETVTAKIVARAEQEFLPDARHGIDNG